VGRVLRFKKGEHACAYCNEHPGIEKEHVIPKGFFPPDDNGRRIIVPACEHCNDKFSQDEEYARMVFTMELRGGEHPAARALMNNGKAYRALQQNRKLLKSMLDTTQETRLRTRGGIELPGIYHTFVIERRRIDRFIDKVIRGVFFADTQERLPKEYITEYWTGDKISISKLPDEAKNALLLEPLRIAGNNVFQYRFLRACDDPMRTMWMMRFYEGIIYVVFTKPSKIEEADIQDPQAKTG
jgi:hypothetical protein